VRYCLCLSDSQFLLVGWSCTLIKYVFLIILCLFFFSFVEAKVVSYRRLFLPHPSSNSNFAAFLYQVTIFVKSIRNVRLPPAVAKKLGNPYLRTHVLTSTDQLLLILIFWYFAKQAILLSKSTFLSLPLRQGLPEQVFWLLVGVYSWRVVHIFKCIVANFSPPLVMK
jgi:hypothetical protein